MKKILLILTGGTIGSRIDNEGHIAPVGKPLLLEVCKEWNSVHFDVLEPFNVLSENMTLNHRETLIKEILKVNTEGYDGIIIAHGSDTLTYTASLLAMALRHIDIPIVFIASDYVLSDPRSNGPDNFDSAVTLICNSEIQRGAFICYKNHLGENTVYLATRLCSAEPFTDCFHPFDNISFGKTEDRKFIYNPHELNPSISDINTPKEPIIKEDFSLSECVAMVYSSPAFDYNRFDILNLSAVLNYGYHCGTVNESQFLNLAKRCLENRVDVWLASFKDENAPIYESLCEILKQQNVDRLYNLSGEAAYSKLLLAYSVDKILVKENLFYENVKPSA